MSKQTDHPPKNTAPESKRLSILITLLAIVLSLNNAFKLWEMIGIRVDASGFHIKEIAPLGAFLFYAIMITLFIVRKEAKAASTSFSHWIFALSGTLFPLLLSLNNTVTEPYSSLLVNTGRGLQVIGTIMTLSTLAYLGRGFGIIAAIRDIKTGGMYSLVRHPLYASEELLFGSMILQFPCLYNVILFVVQFSCQLIRIRDEEALLLNDPQYQAYAQKTRYRLIPGIY